MDYKKALETFNSTDEYRMQTEFLCKLLKPNKDDTILDYGAGLGNTIEYIKTQYKPKNIWGYDVQIFCKDAPDWYRSSVPSGYVNKVYFMHSFAHIRDTSFLGRMELAPKARAVVITPNQDFIVATNAGKGYIDPTVYKHYNPNQLAEEFELYGWKTIEKGSFGREIRGMKERAYLLAEREI